MAACEVCGLLMGEGRSHGPDGVCARVMEPVGDGDIGICVWFGAPMCGLGLQSDIGCLILVWRGNGMLFVNNNI